MEPISTQEQANWQPERFTIGDMVVDPNNPKWGVGHVVKDETYARSPTVGQRLIVDWPGRGLMTVLTGTRVLRRADSNENTTNALAARCR